MQKDITYTVFIFLSWVSAGFDSSSLPPCTVCCMAPQWWTTVHSLWHHAQAQTCSHGKAGVPPAPVRLGLQLSLLHNKSRYCLGKWLETTRLLAEPCWAVVETCQGVVGRTLLAVLWAVYDVTRTCQGVVDCSPPGRCCMRNAADEQVVV